MPAAGDVAEVAHLSRRIRLLQRRLRRRECNVDDITNGNLTAKTVALLLAVYVFSGHNLDVAAEFLAFKARPQECCWDALQSIVEQAFIAEPTSRIVELMNDTCLLTRKMRMLSAACLFILQYRLFMWLGLQNCVHGVAPSRVQMIRYALSATPTECPLEVQMLVQKPLRGSARRQRKWLQNFRRLWGARVGVLRSVPAIPVREMQEKAGYRVMLPKISCKCDALFGSRFSTPKMVVVALA